MPKTIERPLLSGTEQIRLQAATNLYNQFVLASPAPEFVPQPGRIDRDFKRISALTKKAPVRNRVTDLLGTALAINGGKDKIEKTYDIPPVKDPVIALIKEIQKSSRQRNRTLDALLDSITYLEGRSRTDAHAVAQVRDLLSHFAGTLLQYDPELAITNSETVVAEKQDKAEKNSKQLQPNTFTGLATKADILVDTAGVHRRDHEVDPRRPVTEPVRIRRINAPVMEVEHEAGFARDGATRIVSVPTADGKPLEYAVTIVVHEAYKDDNGKQQKRWRPVQLAPALSPQEVRSGHLESQQIYPWTLDLPYESTKFAVVVEATPWTLDILKKEKGGTVHVLFPNEELERRTTRTFIEALIGAYHSFSYSHQAIGAAFNTFGLSGSQVNLNRYGALRIREFLEKEGREDILAIPLHTRYQGSQEITRLALNFSSRLGIVGNDKTTPIAVMIDPKNMGGELFESTPKPDDPQEVKHEMKETEQQKADKSEIRTVLGIEEDIPGHEVIIVDEISTYTEIEQHMQTGRTPAHVSTRPISTQPLARHESVGAAALESTTVEIVPLVGQKDQLQIVTRPTSISTVGDLLDYLTASEDFANPQPKIRLDSPILVSALAKEKRAQEEQMRQLRRDSYGFFSDGPVTRGGSLSFGDYTGVTTILGHREERGDADVGHTAIIGELPHVTLALTAKLPTTPRRIKDSHRRRLIK